MGITVVQIADNQKKEAKMHRPNARRKAVSGWREDSNAEAGV